MTVVLVILSLALLILAHEAGHFFTAKLFGIRVDEFGFGFPPRIWGVKRGETIYSVNALPFGGFVRIYGEDPDAASDGSDASRSFAVQPVWKRSCVMLAGVLMNALAGWVILSAVFMIGVPAHLAVVDVEAGTPAAAAGVRTGDLILSASSGGTALADPITADDFVALARASAGQAVALTVDRGGSDIAIAVTGRENPPAGEGSLGIAIADTGVPAAPFFASLGNGAAETWQFSKLVVSDFYTLVTQVFVKPSVLKNVAGPVGIVSIADQASGFGFAYFLQFLGLISVNLAVLNLIPFPALDGGKFLFLLIEKAKRSPVSRRVQMAVNVVGFGALIVLMVLVTVQDVARLVVH